MQDPSHPEREKLPDRPDLEGLLEQALDVPRESDAANQIDVDALRAVVRRHRSAPFALDPMAVEMVEILLRSYFGAGDWSGPSLQIARTLFEDPVGRERMERLWNQLAGNSP